jgi:hypothetical protein
MERIRSHNCGGKIGPEVLQVLCFCMTCLFRSCNAGLAYTSRVDVIKYNLKDVFRSRKVIIVLSLLSSYLGGKLSYVFMIMCNYIS